MPRLLAPLAAIACLSCASDPAPKTSTTQPPHKADEPSTRYRTGDYVTYRYSGEALPGGAVELAERVVERDGDVLHIEVTARRGDEEKRWLQVVTDTPENQASNVVDELYLIEGDARRPLDAKDPEVLADLYAWTLPAGLRPGGEAEQRDVEVRAGNARYTCTEATMPATAGETQATFTTTTCPAFVWTHGPALALAEDGRVLWKVSVLAAGRSSARGILDVTGWEGFYPPTVALDDRWLTRRSLPLTSKTLASIRARVGKLVLAGGEREGKEADLAALEAATCDDEETKAWNEDRCRGLAERKCEAGTCRYEHYGNCSGLLAGGGRFVTAAHCVAELDAAATKRSAVLVAGDDGVKRLAFEVDKLGKSDFAHHWVAVEGDDPVDVAVLQVDDGGLDAVPTAEVPPAGDVVFIHGYPRVEGRSKAARESVGYALSPGLPTYSFGRVADRNEDGAALCNIDGRQEHWQLRDECPAGEVTADGEKTWRGPITNRPFLATYDSANGYSGAPVFDREGRWIGVNATVMSPHSPQERYSTLMFQVATPATVARTRLGM